MSKKNIYLILLFLIILLAAGGFILNRYFYKNIESYNAYVAIDTAEVLSKQNGTIKSICVKQSENVKKGQLIAEISVPVSVVKNISNSSRSENIEKEYENAAVMYKDGIISQEEYDKYLNNLTNARKADKESKTSVNYKVTNLYAPIDGEVILNNLKEGDSISDKSLVATINSTETEISAHFPVTYQKKISTGKIVEIMIVKYPEKVLSGKIDEVASPDTAGLPVKISFNEDISSLTLKNGDSVIVKLK